MTKGDFINWLTNNSDFVQIYQNDNDCWYYKHSDLELEIDDEDKVSVIFQDEFKTPESFLDYKGSITFDVFVEKYNQISEDEEREYFRTFFNER